MLHFLSSFSVASHLTVPQTAKNEERERDTQLYIHQVTIKTYTSHKTRLGTLFSHSTVHENIARRERGIIK